MSKERVPLHLPKPNPSGPLPTLHRLMGQDINRSRGPHLDIHTVTQIYHHLIHCISFSFNMEADLELVRDHVPQSLVVQWNLSITDTIGESQFVRYREVSLVERFDILMTIITIIVIHIHSSNHNSSLFS